MTNQKIILAVCAALLVAWFFRWDVVTVPNGGGPGYVFVFNRLTGDAYVSSWTSLNKLEYQANKK